ncbi:Abscisic acid G-protein coupled receptor-like domain [Trypanosoma melophagium]|uniref:Abscisic acid G-protein coupled receptor-like domain n=1 Tax=Trypanosoma melophagium TaxID=715481 RepID=UPI00351A586F|nr:Abscisic acid G-protein coupled receptor-like domain [Trypanosoma melophagium]
MTEGLIGVLLFLGLCYIGTLFGRLVFVYAIERPTTQFCFVVIFALSTFIFTLVLLDASKIASSIFSTGFITHALRYAIIADLTAISLLCPFCILRLLLQNLHLRRFMVLLGTFSILLYLFGSWVPPLRWLRGLLGFGFHLSPAHTLWDAVSTTVALVGILAVGVLSGYAAVTTPVAFIRPLIVRDSGGGARVALGVLAKRQRHLLSLWTSKQTQIAQAWSTRVPSASARGSATLVWGWVAKSLRSGTGDGNSRWNSENVAKLKAESDGIQAVSTAVFLEMNEMDSLLRSAENGATWRGWAEAFLGVILLLHTLLKLTFTTISLLRWRLSSLATMPHQNEDTATRVVGIFETYGLSVSNSEGTERRVAWVSLTLNAWMIISSIRGFLLTVFRLVTLYTAFLSMDTTVLALTTGMGAYFIGQLLLLRLSPTLETQSVLCEVIQEQLPRREFYRRLNDMVFVIASAVTILVRHSMVSLQVSNQYNIEG